METRAFCRPLWRAVYNRRQNVARPPDSKSSLDQLNQQIVNCFRCPRLVAHREHIGVVRRRAYQDQTYWSRPVPGFGDPHARLLIVGLAPGAHGANRTGRMFTGDRSGDFLYPALYAAGFANQPASTSRNDGLKLKDAYLTAAARCAPPDNHPTREELLACRPYLLQELAILRHVQVVVALGGIALEAYFRCLQELGQMGSLAQFPFRHGATYHPHAAGPVVLASYHPSQQNTSTKRLTATMLEEIFQQARSLLH